MIFDITKTQLASNNASLKIIKSGTGTLHVSALGGAGSVSNSVAIPHGYGSNELLIEVWSNLGLSASGGMLPYQTPDGRVSAFAKVDATNLHIMIHHDSNYSSMPATTYQYSYRILIP